MFLWFSPQAKPKPRNRLYQSGIQAATKGTNGGQERGFYPNSVILFGRIHMAGVSDRFVALAIVRYMSRL